MEIELDAEVRFHCSGTLVRGTKEHYSFNFGNWLPGEPDEVRDFKVFKVREVDADDGGTKTEYFEITDWLSGDEHEVLYNRFLEELQNEEGDK